MNIPTLIVAVIVGAVLVAIGAAAVKNKKSGRSSCSCGGDCGSCGHCRH